MIKFPDSIEARLVHFTEKGMTTGANPIPNKPHFFAITVNTHALKEYADYETQRGDALLWWEDGMQNDVCHEVFIITDDLDDGMFILYFAFNNAEYPMLLGKLKPGNKFYDACYYAFTHSELTK